MIDGLTTDLAAGKDQAVRRIRIPTNKNFYELQKGWRDKKFYKVLEGSSGSGKTYSILQYLIWRCMQWKNIRFTALRNDQATTRDSIVTDFKRIMVEQYQCWEDGTWNAQSFEYTFPNGSVLAFRGASDPAKLHGPRRDVAWLNEVMEISYEAFRQISMRTGTEIVMDFNPSLTRHWVFDKVLTRKDALHIHSTFLDNPNLPRAAVEEIMALEPTADNIERGTADEWAWQVYGRGKRGRREGAVFKFWDKTDEWPDRQLCTVWGYGMDFGFANDPTAIVEVALFQDKLYLRERLYEKGLTASENPGEPNLHSIEERIVEKELNHAGARFYCDSARPEIIAALKARGIRAVPVRKTKDSIITGIDRLKSFQIVIHESSINLQVEFEQYAWKRGSGGQFEAKPEDRNNHLIDAARYFVLSELGGRRVLLPGGKKPRRSKRAASNLVTWR